MTRNTLMGKTKEELVDLVLMYKNNQIALEETIIQQYINATSLLKEMDVFNETFEKARKVMGGQQ